MNNLVLAFQITALGMGLVFTAILILWLMMTLLTALTADVASSFSASASDSPKTDSVPETESLAQAAAIGVAMAMAQQQLSSAHPLADPPTAIVSAWQLGMRTRQMTQKGGLGQRHR
jgi:Na+-transporting methylmalonyl-CoA/oxaloacetate decarboxylase gamma subunit